MANNYLQFSFVINNLTPDDRTILEILWELQMESDDLPDLPEGSQTLFTREELTTYWGMFGGPDVGDRAYDLSGTDMVIREDHAWISCEEGSDPAAIVELLQVWLKKTNSPRVIGFTWAETCSRMRIGEFSGGGVAFTKDEARWIDAYTQVQKWLVEMGGTAIKATEEG